MILKHFTARGLVFRCDVLQVGTQATSARAVRFLEAVEDRMPSGRSMTMGPLNRALREREAYYNAERPHQSLGWLSPMEYLAEQRLRTAS